MCAVYVTMCCVIFVSIFVSSINVRFPRVAERSCANLLNPRTGDTVPHHLYTCELRIMLSVISCYLCCESATQARGGWAKHTHPIPA